MKNTNALSKRSLKAYSLLKDLLLTIYNVDCHRSAYPYDNIEDMDRGIRKMMWEGFDYTNNPDTRLIEETDKLLQTGMEGVTYLYPVADTAVSCCCMQAVAQCNSAEVSDRGIAWRGRCTYNPSAGRTYCSQ